jgi:hypothetical protein
MYSVLEGIKDEMVMSYFKILSWHLPERTEENHEIPWSG